jgi:low affinity Fe/Cu permease
MYLLTELEHCMAKRKEEDIFTRFTTTVSSWLGRPWVFVIALVVLIIWAISGPILGFSDTWQLVINTGTTIVTFLMVFIIQNTQNRDNLAINIKLDIIMDKLKISDEDLIEAEAKSDKKLEVQLKKVQNKSEQRSSKNKWEKKSKKTKKSK